MAFSSLLKRALQKTNVVRSAVQKAFAQPKKGSKLGSVFESAIRRNVPSATNYSIRNEPIARMMRPISNAIDKRRAMPKSMRAKPIEKPRIRNRTGRKWLGRAGFGIGALGMLGVNMLKGGMSQARESVHARYMQDYTYSTSMLQNSRVGLASGTNSMLKNSGTQGLSLALSKTRHGKY